ncbi:MAG TPA: hypothetical protein VGX69_12135 [Solirubrobacteraceae bacterium]|nr:hypothetical protein [Solirubrobacteraceae bacterium]
MHPTASTRNAGLELLSRINRWLIAATVVVAGFLSLLAERAFRGHTSSSTGSSAASSTVQPSSSSSSSGSGSGLSSSQSAPAPAPAPAPVVSGGS